MADFLRVELEFAMLCADIALLADDERKRIRNTKNAKTAHGTILQFLDQVAMPDAQAFADGFENLNNKLAELGEMGDEVLGRRLDDRIRKLATIAAQLPQGSSVLTKITERIQTEICEYFEREKNPKYDADRRHNNVV